MPMNPYVGWGVSSLLLYAMNKGSDGSEQTTMEPSELSVTETKAGTPIPVQLGRTLVKSSLVTYYGDFRAEAYTETYAAHAKFSAWPLVFSLVMAYISAPSTGVQATPGVVSADGANSAGPVHSIGTSTGATNKDILTGPLVNALFSWLLMWLINGRNLKTTIQKGFKYYLGYQQLICWSSPGMRIRALWLGQNKVWEGDASRGTLNGQPLVISIDNDQLFGGPDEGGGFIGELHVYLGGANQMPDPWMIAQMNADTVQEELRGLTPAYRPFVSIVVPTAYIGKQATIPEIWVELQWCPDRLGLGAIDDDANPAELLYEIHVNTDWGLAESPELLDTASLLAVGNRLKEEKLGLLVPIPQKGQARTVVDAICEHVNLVRYIDPRTGKLTFKLIRDDYDTATVPVINERICEDVSYTRLDWSETVSEISVNYTDRLANYEQSSINDNDPANIEINAGAKTSKSYDYPYFSNVENALWAAKREGRQQGYPLAAVTIVGNRTLSALRTGEVLCLNWPPYGISNMLLRVTDIDIGDFVEGKVTIEAIEDVFGLEKTEFGFSGSSEWQYGPSYPSGVTYFGYLELPWEMQQENNSHVVAMAVQPDAKTVKWQVHRKQGDEWEKTSGMTQWTAAGRLLYHMDAFGVAIDEAGFEVEDLGGVSNLPQDPDAIVSARRGGNILLLGTEMMAYSTLSRLPNGHWQIKGIIRGIFDTLPVDHAPGETAFFLEPGTYVNVLLDGPVAAAGENVSGTYNITAATVDAEEELLPARGRSITTQRRPERPNPPGRVRMSYHMQPEIVRAASLTGDLTLTWLPRNKQSFGIVSQDDQVNYWTGQAFEVPEGMEFVLDVYVGTDKVASHVTQETSFVYPWAQRCNDDIRLDEQTRIVLWSKENGLTSYQYQERSFTWQAPILADGCSNEAEALAKVAAWGSADHITVPEGGTYGEYDILYTEMPVFILGEKFDAPVQGGLICQDGKWIIADGRMFVVTGPGSGRLVQMDTGFVIRKFAKRYIWVGNRLTELQVTGG